MENAIFLVMTGSGQRLNEAVRRDARYESVEAFAEAIHKKGVTVRQQINRDSVPAKDAHLYCRKLKCEVEWLLYGRGNPPWEGIESPESGGGKDEDRGMKQSSLNEATDLADLLLKDFCHQDVMTILQAVTLRRKRQEEGEKRANPIRRI